MSCFPSAFLIWLMGCVALYFVTWLLFCFLFVYHTLLSSFCLPVCCTVCHAGGLSICLVWSVYLSLFLYLAHFSIQAVLRFAIHNCFYPCLFICTIKSYFNSRSFCPMSPLPFNRMCSLRSFATPCCSSLYLSLSHNKL